MKTKCELLKLIADHFGSDSVDAALDAKWASLRGLTMRAALDAEMYVEVEAAIESLASGVFL